MPYFVGQTPVANVDGMRLPLEQARGSRKDAIGGDARRAYFADPEEWFYLLRVPGFPNWHFPSDHLALLAEFVVKGRKEKKIVEADFGPQRDRDRERERDRERRS